MNRKNFPFSSLSICLLAVLCSTAAWGENFDQILHGGQGNVETWRISQPNVMQPMTEYRMIQFREGDIVTVKADGCVQTGGKGLTWKRYVDPRSSPLPGDIVTPWGMLPDSNNYYGSINIPGATPGFRRIKDILGTKLTAHPSGALNYLQLAYQDDNYSGNGYWGPDVGDGKQCQGAAPAWVEITIEHPNPSGQTSETYVPSGSTETTQQGQNTINQTNSGPGGGGTGGNAPKDTTMPILLSFIATPMNMTYQGGQITVDVRASDNVAVQSITLILIKPDGSRSGLRMPLVNGTPQNGEWGYAWTMPMNTGSTALNYGIQVTVVDSSGNIGYSKTLIVTVAGKPSTNYMQPQPLQQNPVPATK